jgi:transcriptional regulator with XRE-family HTH domain
MTIGNRIKDLRKQKKLNQTELGEIIGVSLNTLYSIETGKSDISSEALLKLSDFFEVSTDYLLKGIETERTISESEQEILEVLRADKAMRNAIMEVAKVKKKAISYLGNYAIANQNAAIG